jgi:hypothetical protein
VADLNQTLALIQQQKAELDMAEIIAIEKGLKSDNAATAVQATQQLNARLKDVEVRQDIGQKSFILDPKDFLGTGNGYRERQNQYVLDYPMLRKMGRVPLIRSIIETRIEQVAAFAVPQASRYAVGFKIVKKRPWGSEKEAKMSAADETEVQRLTEFMLNCGAAANQWHGDSFEEFLRKHTRDSLTLDQGTFEVIRSRKGLPVEFLATDGATYRWAEDAGMEAVDAAARRRGLIRLPNRHSNLPGINGYRPTIVQVLENQISAEYYPWELSLGIRNLHTDSSLGGYGIAELEDLVSTVTGLLDTQAYNANFFKIGSRPNGFLKVKGTVNREKLAEFRTEWRMLMSGVQNAHRTPVLPEDVDWVNLGQSNRDMEYSVFGELLTKLSCSMFKIDPEEIGFKTAVGSGQAPTFEGNNAARLKYSRDKGLYPLLKFTAARLNKYILNALNPAFEFQFVGLDALTEADELEQDIKRLGAYMTFNEIRQRRGLDPVEGGEIIGHSMYLQRIQGLEQAKKEAEQAEAQQADQGGPLGPDGAPLDPNPSADAGALSDPNASGEVGEDDNPFLKSFAANLAIFE